MKTKYYLLNIILFLQLFQVVNAYTGLTPDCECKPLEEIRQLSKKELEKKNPKLALLYDLPYVPNHKLAYSLAEFMALPNTRVANSECIGGNYSRFIIGKKRKFLGLIEQRIVLVSAPYTGDELQISPKIYKTAYISELLRTMCYEPVDSGWISKAEWSKLTGDANTPSLRFTNRNFLPSGRITDGGEYLLKDSDTHIFILKNQLSVMNSLYSEGEITFSNYGNNFPMPGYLETALRPFLPSNNQLKKQHNAYWPYDEFVNPDPAYLENNLIKRTNLKGIYTLNKINKINEPNLTYGGSYVMDCMGSIYLIDLTTHGTPMGAAAIVSAGYISIFHGEIVQIDNSSGHYKPTCDNLRNAIDYLNNNHAMNLPEPKSDNGSYLCSYRKCKVYEVKSRFYISSGENFNFDKYINDNVYIPNEIVLDQSPLDIPSSIMTCNLILTNNQGSTSTTYRRENSNSNRFIAVNLTPPVLTQIMGTIKLDIEKPNDYQNEGKNGFIELKAILTSCVSNSSLPRKGIDNNSQSLSFAVYPNPTKDKLSLSFNNLLATSAITITVQNSLGEVMIINKIKEGENLNGYQLDISHLNSGIYTIKALELPLVVAKFVVIY